MFSSYSSVSSSSPSSKIVYQKCWMCPAALLLLSLANRQLWTSVFYFSLTSEFSFFLCYSLRMLRWCEYVVAFHVFALFFPFLLCAQSHFLQNEQIHLELFFAHFYIFPLSRTREDRFQRFRKKEAKNDQSICTRHKWKNDSEYKKERTHMHVQVVKVALYWFTKYGMKLVSICQIAKENKRFGKTNKK